MSDDRVSRKDLFFRTLLAGVIPMGGFGKVPSLKLTGYQSPKEKTIPKN